MAKWILSQSAVAWLFLNVVSSTSFIPPNGFRDPQSEAVDSVNPLIGNGGDTPNGSGGMIPSTAPPFAMTRWVAQTRANYVSVTPYNHTDSTIHGFQGTHQPAIWMGESGQVAVVPGEGEVKADFDARVMRFSKETEVASASYYSARLEVEDGGSILAEQSATSRVGHFRFTFNNASFPYILMEATRPSILGSPASPSMDISYPHGTVTVDPGSREICGSNPERQDAIIAPVSTPAKGWSGYFCARFDRDFGTEGGSAWGVVQNGTVHEAATNAAGPVLSAYARFVPDTDGTTVVNVRVGVSFISVDQARANLGKEVPDETSLEETAKKTRTAWAEKLDRIQLEGASEDQRQTFYTSFYHTLQYPYEQDEDGKYYSGYDDAVHEGESYTGYSIWDTYRAEWAWLILFAPERIPGMVNSMLQDYEQGGWLPMWKNIIETNIMVATHADSLIAQAAILGVQGFDLDKAYEAVHKDATVPPVDDATVVYADREEDVDYEVRAGLSSVYEEKGWVANDIHSEAASRTLDYSYDDYAVAKFAAFLNKSDDAAFFLARSLKSPFTIFNTARGFMEARNASGAWAGPEEGWTEGDEWAYTFDVVHDVPGLIERRGGNESFVAFLDEHFDGGHNDHTNEPSHHIPYLYSLAGAASKTQERVREVTQANYNNTVDGLSGNEDCGQMSAWYLFSALGFYPVDPVSGQYVVGAPFFNKVTIKFPDVSKPLVITSTGASKNHYVADLSINGRSIEVPVIRHEDFANGGDISFEMSPRAAAWASSTLIQSYEKAEKLYREL